MDLCCLPRSLPTLLPTRSHLRPTSPLFRPISAPTSFKSLTSISRPEFRATASEEPSTFVAETEKYETEEAPFEFVPGKEPSPDFVPGKEPSPEKSAAEDFISKVNLKFDSDDTYSIAIYGTGALVALWLSSAVVGALDSIPLVPKLFEVVGLAYTIWFSYRYLIFKKNREELFAKIGEIKGQIIGQDEN